MNENNPPTYKMLQLDMPRYEKVEEEARKRRVVNGGALRPQWADLVKQWIDEGLARCAKKE